MKVHIKTCGTCGNKHKLYIFRHAFMCILKYSACPVCDPGKYNELKEGLNADKY